MKYRVRYSPLAKRDLDDIWDGVVEASGSVDVAQQYINGIIAAVKEKSVFPRAGIPVIGLTDAEKLYSVNYKAYKAFYYVSQDSIEVVRVLYAGRDYMKILFPGEDEHL